MTKDGHESSTDISSLPPTFFWTSLPFSYCCRHTETQERIHQNKNSISHTRPSATMKGKKEDPNAMPRRGSQPKAPTGLDDEAALETHDLIHRAEEEEQKVSRGGGDVDDGLPAGDQTDTRRLAARLSCSDGAGLGT